MFLLNLGLTDSYGGKFFHCVVVSFIILSLCLLGAEMFAKTALLALFVIVAAYGSFLFTVFLKPRTQISIPKSNTMAYLVFSNLSDPNSEKILNYNQSLYANYTSFRYNYTFII